MAERTVSHSRLAEPIRIVSSALNSPTLGRMCGCSLWSNQRFEGAVVYIRPRAWLGQRLELPQLLKGVDLPTDARCLDLATGLGWGDGRDSAGSSLRNKRVRRLRFRHPAPCARVSELAGLGLQNDVVPRGRQAAAFARSSDLAVCLYGLHHLRGYLEALKEIARVLKPSGAFAMIDPVRSKDKPHGGHCGIEILMRAQLMQLLDQARFEVILPRVSFGAGGWSRGTGSDPTYLNKAPQSAWVAGPSCGSIAPQSVTGVPQAIHVEATGSTSVANRARRFSSASSGKHSYIAKPAPNHIAANTPNAKP
jgi:SAM-dependent methyltransferase